VKLLLEAGATLPIGDSSSSGVESSVLGRCVLKGSSAVCFELLLDAPVAFADGVADDAAFPCSGVSQSTLWWVLMNTHL
jgi:hypothetical protein